MFSAFSRARHLFHLNKMAFATRAKIKESQQKRLTAMLLHAYEKVPYYRAAFKKAGLGRRDLQKPGAINRVPLLDKKPFQKNENDLLATDRDKSRLVSSRTSGSTGIHLNIYMGTETAAFSDATMYHAYFAGGLKWRDILADLGIYPYKPKPPFLFQRLGFLRHERIEIQQPLPVVRKKLLALGAQAYFAYPTFLSLLARHAEGLRPRVLFNRGEMLFEKQRRIIEDSFDAPIRDLYGTAEVNRLAYDCPHGGGMHWLTEASHAHVLDKNGEPVGEGEKGEIVITNLYNQDMPIIRFRIGDIGALEWTRCACGRRLPQLTAFEGRADDFLTLPSGQRISPRNVTYLEDIPGLDGYQVVQKRPDYIMVRVIPGADFDEKSEHALVEEIKRGCLFEPIHVEIKRVTKLKRYGLGKIRKAFSEVKP